MLILPALLRREIEVRTRRALPDETCGLLLGRRRGKEVEVAALVAARNIALEPRTRFELDPLDLLAAEDGARANGLEVVGVWHSHPRGPLEGSRHDHQGSPASWLSLIAVPKPRHGLGLACWRQVASGFEPMDIAEPLTAHG
ncbi:MAG TPA: M67 family metallopeptidase [Planctomycetota bacterium]|nr:M67 family metallopeptidase [Planctomycetota bacterium]